MQFGERYFPVWIAYLALLLALASGCISLWCFIDSKERPKKQELRELLEQSSATVLEEYARKFRALETEWDDMYQKFGRLAGRMDRQRALNSPPPPEDSPNIGPQAPLSRADLLRKWRGKT